MLTGGVANLASVGCFSICRELKKGSKWTVSVSKNTLVQTGCASPLYHFGMQLVRKAQHLVPVLLGQAIASFKMPLFSKPH